MSEKAQRASQKIQSLRANLRQFTRRPQVTMRDVVNQFRTNIATQMYGQVSSGMNPNQQEASQPHPQVLVTPQQGGPQPQEQGSLLGRGRPILGSLMGRFQQQQAPQQPQVSAEQAELMREEQLMGEREQQRVFEEKQKLAKLKRQKRMSFGHLE